MRDEAGNFPYDVALMETNRGCPYKCSFCYWGGAVGQRMRSFSRARLAAELDFFGFHQIPTLVLCDSNFGLLEADQEFVEDLIKTRERRGYPRALETSWAKNKSDRFYRIVRDLTKHGFKSSFTLALQTLADPALTDMSRRNMNVNKWESLVGWLNHEGLDCYAELIWGAPGETPESFLAGFDKLAEKVSRIAVYPLLLLPNTDYLDKRDLHGFVTVRGEDDDFEYVLANRSASLTDHLRVQRFVFWARLLGENQYFRHLWRPTRDLTGLTQSQIITSVQETFSHSTDAAAIEITNLIPVIAESPAISAGLRKFYTLPTLENLLRQWWQHTMVPRFPKPWQTFAVNLYTFESWTRPRYVAPDTANTPTNWHIETDGDEPYYVTDTPVAFDYDIAAILDEWPTTATTPPLPKPTNYLFRARVGFHDHLDNHETGAHYTGAPIRTR
jgi:radical SAM C-methyltransferase